MNTKNIWIAGLVIAIIGSIISWQAFLKEEDPRKKQNRIAIGTIIGMFGVGVFMTAWFVEYKVIKA